MLATLKPDWRREMTDHISDRIAATLEGLGFSRDGLDFTRMTEGVEEAGSLSNGRRLVRLSIDETGRYLERKDGWGKVEEDVDLRYFTDDVMGAIERVLP